MDRKYECMLIMRSDLSEKELNEAVTKITKKIEKGDGKVSVSKLWLQEREFYFPIRSRGAEKKKFMKGLYWFIEFNLDPVKLPDVKEVIRLEERVLRNLIVVAKEVKVKVTPVSAGV